MREGGDDGDEVVVTDWNNPESVVIMITHKDGVPFSPDELDDGEPSHVTLTKAAPSVFFGN